MKYFLIFFIFISGCSFSPTTDSDYWTEGSVEKRIKKNDYKKKIPEILKKSKDIRAMTLKEYEIYLDSYTNKSKYPNLSK